MLKYKDIIDDLHESILIINDKFDIQLINSNCKNLLRIENVKKIKNLKSIFNKDILNIIKTNSSLLSNNISDYEFLYLVNNVKIFIKASTQKINDINDEPIELIILRDHTKEHKDLLLKSCMYDISEATHFSNELEDLYKKIHHVLMSLIDTKNFYIAIADWENNIIHFPYFVDQYDKPPKSKLIEDGLTEYVLKKGESILVNPEQYDSILKNKQIEIKGRNCVDWLGVPLKTDAGLTIGVIVVQSYDKTIRFNEEDKRIVQFVSDQIAMAIKRKMDELQIKKQAYYDQLTGLTNKSLFNDRLNQNIYDAERNDSILAVLFVDLDNFKYVNDSMGHNAGDRLIKIVSNRIKDCLRKTDTVARWGGDEFTIMLPDVKDIANVFNLCSRILNKELSNIVIDNQELRITASIGISMYPQDGDNAETLIKNADTAMYKAKEKGKNTYQLYKPKMNQKLINRINNENNLFKAIDKEEFILLYQPQVDLKTNKIIGFESLIRWNSPEKGVLAPYKFIPLAEETNLIVPLGEWIIEKTCIQNKKWHDAGYNITSAVNISGKQFMNKNLAKVIKKILDKTALDPKYLELELTETILMDNFKYTVDILTELKDMGVKISIDDFGTGYSSLSYLKRFPIDTLKIDQSFISSLSETKSTSSTIANIVIDLGHRLGMKVIAEGVETEQQLSLLKEYACDKIQGYVISEPVNEIEFDLLLKNDNK